LPPLEKTRVGDAAPQRAKTRVNALMVLHCAREASKRFADR